MAEKVLLADKGGERTILLTLWVGVAGGLLMVRQ